MRKLAFVFLGLAVLTACDKTLKDGVHDDRKMARELRESPESVMISGTNLVLTTYLWRDFMPIAEPGGSEMMAAVNLQATAGDFPAGVEPERLYVIYENQIWATSFESISQTDSGLEMMARGGPKWGPDEEVDAVVMFIHDGKTHYIQAKDQMIQSTH